MFFCPSFYYFFLLFLFCFFLFFLKRLYLNMRQFNYYITNLLVFFFYFLFYSLNFYSWRRIFPSMLPHFKIKVLSYLDIFILHMFFYKISNCFYCSRGSLVIRSF